MVLKEKVKNLPSSPGVYLMKDSLGSIIYVGKAKDLKRRVQSYFRNINSHHPKVEKLVKHLRDFEFITTDTEFEAFMLESKLIKKIKPVYNKQLKSPLSYTYIVIQRDKEYPFLEITNIPPIDDDCTLHFGPYTNKNTAQRAVQGIKECFKIICSRPALKSTACLNYSLGLCIGMCLGGSAVKQYKIIINKIIALLNGTDLSILEELKQKMLDAAEKFDFETAAKYRDYIDAANSLINKEKVIAFIEENKNIAIIEHLSDCIFKLFLIKRNQILFSEKYLLGNLDMEQLGTMIRKNVLTYFKTKAHDSSKEVNRDEIDEAQIIYSYLKGSSCKYITIPEKWLESEDNANIDQTLYKLICGNHEM